jgi:hypothetical protein
MPVLTRWFVKTALLSLVLALLIGVLHTARAVLNLPEYVVYLGPVYFHLFLVGWATQLIIGVVYWMFPKFSTEKPRGSGGLAWATYGLLNVGLALRAVIEPLYAQQPEKGWGWLLALSALMQWLGGMAFVLNTWARVKER